jgi:hypothetical protein
VSAGERQKPVRDQRSEIGVGLRCRSAELLVGFVRAGGVRPSRAQQNAKPRLAAKLNFKPVLPSTFAAAEDGGSPAVKCRSPHLS